MREVVYSEQFLKDLKKLRGTGEFEKIKKLSFTILPQKDDLSDFNIKKIKGFKNYYRIRIGNYRIGIKVEGLKIIFMRVLDRKDIYKYFP